MILASKNTFTEIYIKQFSQISEHLFSCSVVSNSLASWTAAHQASPSFTISQCLLKLMTIELVVLFNHFIFCHLLLLLPSIFPRIRVFSNELAFCVHNIGTSSSVLPMTIQGWFPLGLIDLISVQPKGLSRVFSNITVWKHQFGGCLKMAEE